MLRKVDRMEADGQNFQVWPGAGQVLDPRVLEEETAMRKEGCISGKASNSAMRMTGATSGCCCQRPD